MKDRFKINEIILMESNFKRNQLLNIEDENFNPTIDIKVHCDANEDQNIVIVTEKMEFTNTVDSIIEIEANITMVGIFQREGNMPMSLEEFGNVNGAAILYPYIREILSNLALKAGLGSVLLPPANFVKLHRESVKDFKSEEE